MKHYRNLALAGVFGLAATMAQASTLTTLFDANNEQDGNMFDVLIGSSDLTVGGFDLNLDAQSSTADLEFHYRVGSFVGHENPSDGWTLVTVGSVTSAGHDNPTSWDIPETTFSAGQTYGFYLTATAASASDFEYTNGTGVGNVVASNADLTIFEGNGVVHSFGFAISSRIWNGTIRYELAPVPLPATAPLLLAGLGLLGFAHRRRARG